MRNHTQGGFTLIELVVVIVLLGILAAFAVPRFISLEVKTRAAATEGMSGNLRSVAALSHGLWLAKGSPATVTMEGNVITMTNGYPSAATVGDTLVEFTGFTAATAGTTTTFTKNGAAVGANCSVAYTEPAAAGDPPSVVVNVSDCS